MASGAALQKARKKRKGGIHINPAHKGELHRALGVAEGKPIPANKLQAALRSASPDVRRKANFARNAKSWSH